VLLRAGIALGMGWSMMQRADVILHIVQARIQSHAVPLLREEF
jgi:hypothetical protein